MWNGERCKVREGVRRQIRDKEVVGGYAKGYLFPLKVRGK